MGTIPVHADLDVGGRIIGRHEGDGSGLTGLAVSVPIGPNVPTGTLSRQYTFTANSEGWATSNSGQMTMTWNATDKSLECATLNADVTNYLYEPGGSGNLAIFELEADLTILTGDTAGLLFNITNASDYGMVVITNDAGEVPGVYLVDQTSGYAVQTANRSLNFSTAAIPIRILIRRIDNKVSIYVNGTFAFTATIQAALTNKMGFTSINGTARLDNLRVYTNVDPYRPIGGVSVHATNVAVDPGVSNLPINGQIALDQLSKNLVGMMGKRSFLVSGGEMGSPAGLFVTISPATYYINGKLYSSPAQTLTLTEGPSNSSYGRIDVIALTTSGTAIIVQGQEGSYPLHKPPINEGFHLELAAIAMSWGQMHATDTRYPVLPEGTSNWAVFYAADSFNPNSTTLPRTGSKSIEVTAPQNLDAIVLRSTLDYNYLAGAFLNLFVKRKEGDWAGRYFMVQLALGGAYIGKPIPIKDGQFGLDLSVDGYQQVIVPLDLAGVPSGTQFDEISIQHRGAGATSASGIFIDDMYVGRFNREGGSPLSGFGEVIGNSGSTTVATRIGQSLRMVGRNSLVVNASSDTVAIEKYSELPVVQVTGNRSHTVVYDGGLGLILKANCILTLSGPAYENQRYTIYVGQDEVGGHTFWIEGVNYPSNYTQGMTLPNAANTYIRIELAANPAGLFDVLSISPAAYPMWE